MLQLTNEYKEKVVNALQEARRNYTGSDRAFAIRYGINSSVYSRLMKGERDRLMDEAKWLDIGRMLNITLSERKWNTARTDVFRIIEEDILFCKEYSKGRICVDECGIGKTYTARYLSRTLQNCFYVDGSQVKTKYRLIRAIAKAIGIDRHSTYAEDKDRIKYYLGSMPKPVIIIDEAGDLEYPAFLELKELINATEGICGWYFMGAHGLRAKLDRGIRYNKVGFEEMFSRLSKRYTTIVPIGREDKLAFYRKLITDVLLANGCSKDQLTGIVRRCLITDADAIGDLRRAESLLILNRTAV